MRYIATATRDASRQIEFSAGSHFAAIRIASKWVAANGLTGCVIAVPAAGLRDTTSGPVRIDIVRTDR